MSKLIFITGQSGCGKGAISGLIQNSYNENQLKTPLIVVVTGDEVRSVLKMGEKFSNLHIPRRLKEINDASKAQPGFLMPVFIFNAIIDRYTAQEDILIDGSPRSIDEVNALATFIKAGYLPKATIVWLKVSNETAFNRMLHDKKRKDRADSNTEESIRSKMSWYPQVINAILYARDRHPDSFNVIELDGERTPDEIMDEYQRKM